ncbi:MAG: hypothetical protein SGJ20_13090 [Planctomycetota bacterium]|nr:hypothetical protein [Planctomycetota bacterium]
MPGLTRDDDQADLSSINACGVPSPAIAELAWNYILEWQALPELKSTMNFRGI